MTTPAPVTTSREAPTIVCGPTAGCGRAAPMVRMGTDLASGNDVWAIPERCPGCGHPFVGSRTLLFAQPAAPRADPVTDAARVTRLEESLAFARSVIKAREPWTPVCDRMIDGVLFAGMPTIAESLRAREAPDLIALREDVERLRADAAQLDWLDARSIVQASQHPDHEGETVTVAFLPLPCSLAEGEYGSIRDLLGAAMQADGTPP